MKPKFLSSVGSSKNGKVHTNSHKVEIMISNNMYLIIRELFDSLLERYKQI